MRWIFIGGLLLMLVGFAGVTRACLSDWSMDENYATSPAPDEGDDDAVALWGAAAGLVLALGAGLVVVGLGRWNAPVPSKERPANPWNEQPKDSGEPPVGLV